MTVPETLRTAIPASRPARSWLDRLLDARDALYASPAFHRFASVVPPWSWITAYRSRRVFDLVGGFVYSQVIASCCSLDLFVILADGPQDLADLARRTGVPAEGLQRLLAAAESLGLAQRRSAGRWGLGAYGSPLVHDRALARMVAHNQHFYRDLADPLAILRKAAGETELSRFWTYAATESPETIDAATAAEYSGIMADTIPPLAADVLDHYDVGRHRLLMDVGGGEGVFAAVAAARHPALQVRLFDLPAVAARAQARFAAAGLAARATAVGGDFHAAPLPAGADCISLVRVLLDHGDEKAQALVQRVREALPPGGTVLIAEPFGGTLQTRTLADAYFGLYLYAMGQGRVRPETEHRRMLDAAGFVRVRRIRTRTPLWTDLLVAEVPG